ncbi:hypothetical protein JCM5353_007377 [Sporobolomyces roseus]
MEERRGDPQLSGNEEDLWDEGAAVDELYDGDTYKRYIMLACACLLGLGSMARVNRHFGAYVLGPIKSSLKTSETGFASFIASFELLNTITPLLSGFLVPRYGAANVGIFATGFVLLGQIIVCFSQDDGHFHPISITGTISGLLLFGGGISPVSVVQETIILSSNTSKTSSVGRSVALGLVLGKTSSFLAGASSDWLHSISPRLPFAVASGFALISFIACLVFARVEKSLSHFPRRQPSSLAAQPTHKHGPVNLASYAHYGDPFWLYIAICCFAGTWYTTIHLSTNLLQAVYDIEQGPASKAASILLLSPTFLYPLAGWALDKRPDLMSTLYLSVPTGLACSFFALIFLSSVVPYTLAFLGGAISCGFGPLLSVLVVPRIVGPERISAALALHKSLEMAGAISFQSISGYLLSLSEPIDHSDDRTKPHATHDNPDSTLFFLLAASLVQLGLVAAFWGLMRRRGLDAWGSSVPVEGKEPSLDQASSLRMRVSTERLRGARGEEEQYGLLTGSNDANDGEEDEDEEGDSLEGIVKLAPDEARRGRRYLIIAGVVVLFSWVCFAVDLLR